jgi:hypothetical protein
MIYRKVPQCRICRSKVGDKIDLDLLHRVSYKQLMLRYGEHFSEEKPLTKSCLQGHWKHLREAIDVAAIQQKPNVPAVLSPANEPHDPVRQEIFADAVRTRVNEIEILEELVVSGMEDLKKLQRKSTDDEDSWDVVNRDRVRRNTASITMDSAKVKQMAVQADEDRHRLEKGRVVFRMFQLFARALETCPADYRGLIASQLKEVIRDDDEINALLKEQAGRPAVPESTDA